jgi:hypothetical protein
MVRARSFMRPMTCSLPSWVQGSTGSASGKTYFEQ